MATYPPPTEDLAIFDSSVFNEALVEGIGSNTPITPITSSTTERIVIKQLGGFSSENTNDLVQATQQQNVYNVGFLGNSTTTVSWDNCLYSENTELIPAGNYLITGQINLNYGQPSYNITNVNVHYGLSGSAMYIIASSSAGGIQISSANVARQVYQFNFSNVIYIDGATSYSQLQLYITAFTSEFGTVPTAYGNDAVQELTITKIS